MADIAGHVEDLATRVCAQAAQFEQLSQSTETMVSGNREIDRAAREAQRAASAAGSEIAESRSLIGGAVEHIGRLTARQSAGSTVPLASPKPMRARPGRSHQPRRTTWSPSSRNTRDSPVASGSGRVPPSVSSISEPA